MSLLAHYDNCKFPPDPARFRQSVPGRLWRAWEYGELTREASWTALGELWGRDDVARLLGLEVGRAEA